METRLTFPSMPGLPIPPVAGIRLHIEGMAWCYLELIVDGESRYYGGPVQYGWLSPIWNDPDSIVRSYMRFMSPSVSTSLYFDPPVHPTACILHHESASDAPHVLCEFHHMHFSPLDYDEIVPFLPVSSPRQRYKPSLRAHRP